MPKASAEKTERTVLGLMEQQLMQMRAVMLQMFGSTAVGVERAQRRV